MQNEKSSAMVELTEIAKQFEWHLAIDHWFENGSVERLIALLRENRPMRDEEARFVAAIFAGDVRHWGARGGPSIEKRRQTHYRDVVLRSLFRRVLKIKKRQAKRHPEMHFDARGEAREYVSACLRKKLSADAVKKIVEGPKPLLFEPMHGEANAALVALREQFRKKP